MHQGFQKRLRFFLTTIWLLTAGLVPLSRLEAQTLDDLLGQAAQNDQPVVTLPGPGSQASAPVFPPPEPDDAVQKMREAVAARAFGEVGKVNHKAGSDGFKIGWQNLCEYYRSVYRLTDLQKERPTWYQALKAPLKRIEGGPAHWCGIFNTWAWRTSGLPVYWDTRIIGCKYRGDIKNIQKGDICILKLSVNPYNHHCLVYSRDGDTLTTIDGNQAEQQILKKTRPIRDIEIFYSVADAMGAALPKTTGGSGGTASGKSVVKPPSTAANGGTISGSPGKTVVSAALPGQELAEIRELLRQLIDAILHLFCGL